MRELLRAMYGVYAWTTLGLLVLTTTIVVSILPGLERRRNVARFAARVAFACCGIPVRMRNCALPDQPCVVVANHASYLDGIVLFATLPSSFRFIVKREMTAVPIAHLLLRRIGTEFVERIDARRSATDARRILRSAGDGGSLAAFPEGTFRTEPGVGQFRPGAFTAAVRAGLPVVPVTLRGTRHILPASRWLPRPGNIEVVVHAPIEVRAGGGKNEALRVGDLARQAIVAELDEPALNYRLDISAGHEPADR